jgi:hypothetical protein
LDEKTRLRLHKTRCGAGSKFSFSLRDEVVIPEASVYSARDQEIVSRNRGVLPDSSIEIRGCVRFGRLIEGAARTPVRRDPGPRGAVRDSSGPPCARIHLRGDDPAGQPDL